MNVIDSKDFWEILDEWVNTYEIVIDRPKGSTHPRYPSFRYRLDYGYLKNTASMDGDGIDVWLGSDPARRVPGSRSSSAAPRRKSRSSTKHTTKRSL